MAYADITARLKADMLGVSNIGSVHEYKRLVRTISEMHDIYERGNEILADTGFDDDTKWPGDWTVSGSLATVTADGSALQLWQNDDNFANALAPGAFSMGLRVSANSLDNADGSIQGPCNKTTFTYPAAGEWEWVDITVLTAASNFKIYVEATATSGSISLSEVTLGRRGKIHFWEIHRRSSPDPTDYNTLVLPKSIYELEGFYSIDDSAETEATFQAEIDGIIEAINDDRTLNSLGYVYEPVRVPDIDEEMKVGVLCHHTVIEVPVMTAQDLT